MAGIVLRFATDDPPFWDSLADLPLSLSASADAPPLSVIATATLAGIPITEEDTLSPGSAPTLLLPNGSKFNGTYTILRYLGRKSINIPNLYKRDDLVEYTQIDEWLDYARHFKFDSGAITHLNTHFEHQSLDDKKFLVGNSLSVADLAIWFNLAVTGAQRWLDIWSSGRYPYLELWYTSIYVAHGAHGGVLDEVLRKYVGIKYAWLCERNGWRLR